MSIVIELEELLPLVSEVIERVARYKPGVPLKTQEIEYSPTLAGLIGEMAFKKWGRAKGLRPNVRHKVKSMMKEDFKVKNNWHIEVKAHRAIVLGKSAPFIREEVLNRIKLHSSIVVFVKVHFDWATMNKEWFRENFQHGIKVDFLGWILVGDIERKAILKNGHYKFPPRILETMDELQRFVRNKQEDITPKQTRDNTKNKKLRLLKMKSNLGRNKFRKSLRI